MYMNRPDEEQCAQDITQSFVLIVNHFYRGCISLKIRCDVIVFRDTAKNAVFKACCSRVFLCFSMTANALSKFKIHLCILLLDWLQTTLAELIFCTLPAES